MRLKLTKSNIRNLEARPSRYEVSDTEMPTLRLRVTPAGVKTFGLLYRNADNKQCRYTIGKFGELTPEQAREIAQRKLAEIKLGQDPAAEKQAKRRAAERERYLTLDGFLTHKYGPWFEQNRKHGATTIKRLRGCFREFLDRRLTDITAWSIEKWRKERLKQGRAPATVNRDLAALKSALQRAVEWDLIEVHPLSKVKLAKVDDSAVVRFLSDDEEQRLRKALTDRDEAMRQARVRANVWRAERGFDEMPELGTFGDHLTPMVLLSLNTGLRRGEVFNLEWRDVDLERGNLTVRGTGAKSGKTRHIPLNSEAVRVLKTWQAQSAGLAVSETADSRVSSPPKTPETGVEAGESTESAARNCANQKMPIGNLVFPGRTGERFDNVKSAWSALLADAQITGFRWHDMRHHFASRLVMAGVDLNTVRELLGHSELNMTLRYSHLAPAHKAAAVARLVEAV